MDTQQYTQKLLFVILTINNYSFFDTIGKILDKTMSRKAYSFDTKHNTSLFDTRTKVVDTTMCAQ